jgi:large subunit ribosomal protein L9
MDVVLLKDVERVGREGTVVRVTPGFARNYLLPRGLAAAATAAHLEAVQTRQRQQLQKAQRLQAQAEALKRRVDSGSLTLTLRVGEGDRPFGSISVQDLLEALAQQGLSVPKHAIQLEEPIKTLGIHQVPIRLHPQVTATMRVWVTKSP